MNNKSNCFSTTKYTEKESVQEVEADIEGDKKMPTLSMPPTKQSRSLLFSLRIRYSLVKISCCLVTVAYLTTLPLQRSERGYKRQLYVTHNLKPKSLVHYYDEDDITLKRQIQNVHKEHHPPGRTSNRLNERRLQYSPEEEHKGIAHFESETCKAQYEWQNAYHPNCNFIHEVDLMDFSISNGDSRTWLQILNSGSYREAWRVPHMRTFSESPFFVLKTLSPHREFDSANYGRHTRDALVAERLTSSRHILDIYGFCGNSVAIQYAPGGDLSIVAFPGNRQRTLSIDKLRIATEVAEAVADIHNVDSTKWASIAHTDISPDQFLFVDGVYKLNDFNRAQFIGWDEKDNAPCKFRAHHVPGKYHAPEEYNRLPLDEKIDIYTMGNIFYEMVTGQHIFFNDTLEEAQWKIRQGKHPNLPDRLKNTQDLAEIALLEAMRMCHIVEQGERSNAREVLHFLVNRLEAIVSMQTIV